MRKKRGDIYKLPITKMILTMISFLGKGYIEGLGSNLSTKFLHCLKAYLSIFYQRKH